MNGRQAARAAAKRVEELEYVNARNARDIKAYNECILAMIDGDSPCDWCEEKETCTSVEKSEGCAEWMLAWKYGDED